MIPNPPPQMSEAVFRVYEPYIHAAVQAWPEETRWPQDHMVNESSGRRLSPHTFAARLRDSVVSYQRFGWDSYIDRKKFTEIYGKFCVAFDKDGSIWFRNRGRSGRPLVFAKEAHAQEAGGAAPTHHEWASWSEAEVVSAATLIHHSRLVGPIIFTGEVPQTLQETLMTNYNVAFHYDRENNKTILS